MASVVAGALTGGAGGALVAGAGAAYMNSQKQQSAASTINPDAQYPSENSYQNRQLSQFRQDMNPNGGSIWNSTDPNPYNREQAGPQAGGGGGGSYAAGLQQEGAAGGGGRRPEQQQAPGGQLAGGGGGSPGGGKAGPGGPQAGGGGMGGSPFQSPGVGIDGNFTPTAYAANAAMQSNPVMQTYLLKQVADASDNDPFYDAFSMTVDRQMVARMGAA